MQTPYDWQEAIAHRAEFIEDRLSQGTPALAVSIDAGVLFYTYKRQARKLFEIYDHLAMAGIGQQSAVATQLPVGERGQAAFVVFGAFG